MSLDGRLLARARDRLDEIKQNNEKEFERRREEIYEKLPGLKAKDAEILKTMTGLPAAIAAGGDVSGAIAELEYKSLKLYADRAELLVEGGYKPDFLDEIYRCPKCRDRGYITGRPCSCLLELYEDERKGESSRLPESGGIGFSGFDLSYYDPVPDPETGISRRDLMERVLESCRSYCESFGPNSVNLLLTGDPGLGKTLISSCMAGVIRKGGHSVVFELAPAAVEAFEAQKFSRGRDDSEDPAARVRMLTECDLLILDDLGTEMVTAYSLSAIYTLINSRLLGGGKTIIVTNLSQDEMRRVYSPRIMSRLEGEYSFLKFAGKDIRIIKKTGR
ncbi:MAG: ATP-binding protein [Oscillospiraceae bacterium]|nr:ATP-binding protein [Oscillospiraceae bacterium]